MLEDQGDRSAHALTLHPRLPREGLGDKAQPLTRRHWNQVDIRGCTGVDLGACRTRDQHGHHGHGAGKMSARRTPRAMGVRKSKVETF